MGYYLQMRMNLTPGQTVALLSGVVSAAVVLAVGAAWIGIRARAHTSPPRVLPKPAAPAMGPVRPLPDRFPRNTHLPPEREGAVSGSVDLGTFSAGRDLLYVDDARVWWESDNDEGDVEDDHTMHRAMAAPLGRLVELVHARGGTLEVHDAYRPTGVHNPRSLHREGRAIDVTCDQMSLEELARLSWAAGFDWVYHEASAKGGAHVHCSVRRDTAGDSP